MDKNTYKENPSPTPENDKQIQFSLLRIFLSVIVVGGILIYTIGVKIPHSDNTAVIFSDFEGKVILSGGIVLPILWRDLGLKMIRAGVIDAEKFESIYIQQGNLNEEIQQLLYGTNNGYLKITSKNSRLILNLLWALGLATKNPILENGPMAQYDNIGNLASIGGWTLAKGTPVEHYSRHRFIILNKEQQALVERVSKNVYRPCCNNPTHFPDCNHGMAMLGLLELMAAQGVSEQEMYKVALRVNSYWFPDAYLAIAKYLESKNIVWDEADPKAILGYNFSSASAYRQISTYLNPIENKDTSTCGV